MSHLVVDDFGDLAPWAAQAPDGSESAVVSIGPGPAARLAGATMRISGGQGALGHRVERALGPLDLSRFDDIELWLRCDRAADGSEAHPFFLELRLGSAALGVGSAGNGWQRFLPVAAPNVWQAVPLALDDLPAAVRGAVTQLRLTCVEAGARFDLDLDRATALHPELLADVDAALVDRLGGRLELRASTVPAVVDPAPAPPAPFFRITSYGARPAPERSPAAGFRTDFTGQGFSIRPPAVPFDLLYAVDAATDDRADAATLLEYVYSELTPTSRLDVAGRPLTIEWVEAPQLALPALPAAPTVYLKVSTSQRTALARESAVPPFNQIAVEADTRAIAERLVVVNLRDQPVEVYQAGQVVVVPAFGHAELPQAIGEGGQLAELARQGSVAVHTAPPPKPPVKPGKPKPSGPKPAPAKPAAQARATGGKASPARKRPSPKSPEGGT